MTRGPSHAPNCACPRCRHVRHAALSLRLKVPLYVFALLAGAALSHAFPPEATIPGFAVDVAAR